MVTKHLLFVLSSFISVTQAQQVLYSDYYKNDFNWKVVQKGIIDTCWMYQKRILVQKWVKSGESDDGAYQETESCDLNLFIDEDDGNGSQRPDQLDVDIEVVNDNVLSLETMNDCDDDFISNDFEV